MPPHRLQLVAAHIGTVSGTDSIVNEMAPLQGRRSAAGDADAWPGSGVVVLLAAGWFAHMKIIDRTFAIEVCLQPFGRIRL